MKVLNRPMFRMGGPIKEGIMDGIKEPRRKYNQAGFVLPNDDFSTMQTNKLLSNFNNVNAANAFANIFKPDDRYVNEVSLVPASKKIETPKENIFAVDQIGSDVLDSDFATTIRDPESGKIVIQPPQGLDPITKAKIKANLGIISRSEYQDVLKAEQNKGKGRVFEGEEALIVGDPRELEKDTPIDKVIADKGKIDDEPKVLSRKEKVNNILESLGYDRAQKNALYDAMIKAGQRISRTGLGAENLVSDVIAETSQSYDKPEKLREAANLMQTQQDLKLEQIKEGKTGGTMQQNYEYFLSRGFSDEDAQLKAAGLATNIQEAKSIGLKQNLKGNQLTESVAQQLILTDTYKNNTYKGTINAKDYKSVSEFAKSKDFDGAGVYIVKGRIVELDENGNKIKEDIVTSSSSDKKWWNPLD